MSSPTAPAPTGIQTFKIRRATTDDIPQMTQVSKSAENRFREVPGLKDIAGDGESPETLEFWLSIGRIYVAHEDSRNILGFVAAQPRDELIYLCEISVLLECQGCGVGGKLVDTVCEWAVESSVEAGEQTARVSLNTYPDLPWNGGWYAKRGFREVEAESLGPWHVDAGGDLERSLGRPGWRRCFMVWEKRLA